MSVTDTLDPLLGTSHNETYPVISAKSFARIKSKLKTTLKHYPDAALVGGVALRIWCSRCGIPIPKELGDDIDITNPSTKKYCYDEETAAGWIDIFPSEKLTGAPHYTTLIYEGIPIRLAIPARILAWKMRTMRSLIKKHDKVMAKDILYYKLLKEMVSPEELAAYVAAVPNVIGQDIKKLIDDMDTDLVRLQQNGNVSQAVHPEHL